MIFLKWLTVEYTDLNFSYHHTYVNLFYIRLAVAPLEAFSGTLNVVYNFLIIAMLRSSLYVIFFLDLFLFLLWGWWYPSQK